MLFQRLLHTFYIVGEVVDVVIILSVSITRVVEVVMCVLWLWMVCCVLVVDVVCVLVVVVVCVLMVVLCECCCVSVVV